MNRSDNADRRVQTSGFVGSIVVNSILLYVVHHVLEWQINWILPTWADVLWAVDLTLEVSIVVNVLYILVDARWFRMLGGAVSCAFAALSTWWVMTVFPFDFGSAGTNDIARVMLVLLVIATIIAAFVSAVVGMLELVRAAVWQGGARRRPSS